ncbi:MAG: Phosphatidylglycerol/phosphatidylinositol transfer protein [Pycnora praestabilis]|nr:MAG: Phosphatidylglycerol/phosphatidylinositol transfer protein [Pycnora praestabilis]
MKLISALAPLLLSSLVASKSISFFGSDQQVLGDDLTVPGTSPLMFCSKTDDFILAIEYINLTPNPPEKLVIFQFLQLFQANAHGINRGKTLKVEAAGTFSQDIEEGAYINLQVKYGLIRLINQEADLCEQIKNVDLECPIKKGLTNITKEIELPKEIPKGKYTVLADAYTAKPESKKITCLTTTVEF